MSYHYRAFGLHIQSQIKCPELLPGPRESEIKVIYGNLAQKNQDAAGNGSFWRASENELFLNIDKVAGYQVEDGKLITIDRRRGAAEKEVRLYLLGSVMGALLQQRGYLTLHGSAVKVKDGGVLFLGESGSGKSTMAALFNKHSYHILSDDICAILLNSRNQPVVFPGYPQIKLWADMLDMLELNHASLRRIVNRKNKKGLPLNKSYCDRPIPIKKIYILEKADSDEFELIDMQGPEKVSALMEHIYRPRFLSSVEKRQPYFQQVMDIASKISIRRFIRPFMGGDKLWESVKRVENDVNKTGTPKRLE